MRRKWSKKPSLTFRGEIWDFRKSSKTPPLSFQPQNPGFLHGRPPTAACGVANQWDLVPTLPTSAEAVFLPSIGFLLARDFKCPHPGVLAFLARSEPNSSEWHLSDPELIAKVLKYKTMLKSKVFILFAQRGATMVPMNHCGATW